MALTPRQKFIWRFRMVAHEAQVMIRGFEKTGDVAKVINEDLLFSLSHQALLIVCKFLEIWDGFGALAKGSPDVKNVRGALQPYVDRIRVWKGLDAFRNSTLAHPYLSKKGELVSPWALIADGKAPTFVAESILLLHCVHYAVLGLMVAFPDDYAAIKSLLTPDKPHPGPGPGIAKGIELKESLSKIASEVDSRLAKLGLVVTGPIAMEFIHAAGGNWPKKGK